MGIACIGFSVVLPQYLLVSLYLLDCVIFALSLILFYIGLYPSSEAPGTPSWEDAFPLADIDASTTRKSLAATSSWIMRELPVMEFSSFLKRSRMDLGGGEPMCIVCLGSLKEWDEVRELGNCCHVFHKECIDRWVDVGRLTCPMCRSHLLPRKPWRGVMKQLLSLFRRFS